MAACAFNIHFPRFDTGNRLKTNLEPTENIVTFLPKRCIVAIHRGKDSKLQATHRKTELNSKRLDYPNEILSHQTDSTALIAISAKMEAVALLEPFRKELLDPVTGGAHDASGATEPLVFKPLSTEKTIVLVRHGLSTWNEEGRVQGSSDLSLLSEKGRLQALRCRDALSRIHFDVCLASPVSRAKSSAELMWSGRKEAIVYMDSLREANLLFLEGLKNDEAKQQHPELFRAWREEPENFHVHGVYPVKNLWGEAKKAWRDILSCEGNNILVVTHKSILRALLCTALGLGPERFRAVDLNNGGVCIFKINKHGEPMLESLNLTSHLQTDGVFYTI